MDSKDLLQDLHFQLSNAGSGCFIQFRENKIVRRDHLQLDIEDRTIMTEKWVAQVERHNRQRSLSVDSYFGAVSICDKLKKSFLKPCIVSDNDLEDLRVRIAQIRLEDSDCNIVSDQNNLGPPTDNYNQNSNNFLLPESRPLVPRFRSKTVPFLDFSPSRLNEENIGLLKSTENLCQNFCAMQSVDLIKDILFDENRNVISCQDCQTNSNSKPEIGVKSSSLRESIIPCPNQLVEIKPAKVEEKSSFRCESLFPHSDELKRKGNKKISPNKIVGCYENVESYLKTQFDLLREDFIRPLKEGIADYQYQRIKTGVIPNEVKNLNLHHDVRVIEPRIRDNKLGIAIDMGFPLSEKIGDKNFMEGSLVLLTPNHFKDIFVGTVLFRQFLPRSVQRIERNGRSLRRNRGRKSNILIVQLHAVSHFLPGFRRQKFMLAESQAFFQPFYYVMKIFQGMTNEDVPMQEHIIGSEIKCDVGSPSYLGKNTEYFLENAVKLKVLEDDWPSAEVLNVNDSQLVALKKALCNKLVLIQGPPGTGKTYLGCKVAKALLQNRQVWNKEGNQPMLLMCQTNHALDQFMELLIPVSKKLMRIGCQSKSAILAPYNIREWLKKGRRKTAPDAAKQRNELKSVGSNVRACHAELSKVASHGILNLQTLVSFGVVDTKFSECFINPANFLMWLEEERYSEPPDCSVKRVCSCAKMEMKCYKHSEETALLSKENAEDMKCLFLQSDNNQTEPNIVKGVPFEYVLNLHDLEMYLKEKKIESKMAGAHESGLCNSSIILEDRLNFFQKKMMKRNTAYSPPVGFECLWVLSPNDRWSLYRYWVRHLERTLQEHLELLETHYMSLSSAVDQSKQLEKLEAMRQAELVGMTTSAAARLYPVLRELHCPIALVEEAAEVHESHIVATITKHCQHLILLGDHKQLRPRPASYALSKTHFTDVSLFERLALNKTVPINTLLTQHRMQPQISALIRPSIYAELGDHQCTKNRDHVLGLKKNVFFFSHFWHECKNLLTGSYRNSEEAKMAVQLARYLIKHKYTTDEVCILTAYREQISTIEANCMLYPELENLRVLTVDNFQGEECRIVILSLVRNNCENQIGFLKIKNRVCVALSRARDGLFMLGNIDLLSRNSELWSLVHRTLLQNDSVGHSFPLGCSRHPEKTKLVSCADEFSYYLESGGCQLTCMFRLVCGHFCRKKCHPDDRLHLSLRCQEACQRTCPSGHKCSKKCCDDCGDCDSIVWKLLPCGHKALIKCSLDINNYRCGIPIKKRMEPCSHSLFLQCWMPPIGRKYCPDQCQSVLKCGHRCPLRCNSIKHPNHDEMKCKCEDTSNFYNYRNIGKVQSHT